MSTVTPTAATVPKSSSVIHHPASGLLIHTAPRKHRLTTDLPGRMAALSALPPTATVTALAGLVTRRFPGLRQLIQLPILAVKNATVTQQPAAQLLPPAITLFMSTAPPTISAAANATR